MIAMQSSRTAYILPLPCSLCRTVTPHTWRLPLQRPSHPAGAFEIWNLQDRGRCGCACSYFVTRASAFAKVRSGSVLASCIRALKCISETRYGFWGQLFHLAGIDKTEQLRYEVWQLCLGSPSRVISRSVSAVFFAAIENCLDRTPTFGRI